MLGLGEAGSSVEEQVLAGKLDLVPSGSGVAEMSRVWQVHARKPSSVINAKKERKTTEWERLEISSRKSERGCIPGSPGVVSVCLPSDALLQHLPSYLGFSYLGRGVHSAQL